MREIVLGWVDSARQLALPDERTLLVGAAALAALLLTMLSVRTFRSRRSLRRRARRVQVLASRGVAPAEIARRTGLSRDGVDFVLGSSSVDTGRRNLPGAARIAATEASSPRRQPASRNAQPVAGVTFEKSGTTASGSAYGLPFLLARPFTRNRSPKAA